MSENIPALYRFSSEAEVSKWLRNAVLLQSKKQNKTSGLFLQSELSSRKKLGDSKSNIMNSSVLTNASLIIMVRTRGIYLSISISIPCNPQTKTLTKNSHFSN